MARAPGDLHAASLGQKTMTHTIQCPECGVVLNVPESAAGRKLKCPKCATKFAAPATFGPSDSAFAGSGPSSTMFPARTGPASSGSIELPALGPKKAAKASPIDLPTPGPKKPSKGGDFDLPTSVPLGETYELPMLSDDLPSSKGQAKPADAIGLFLDEPKSNRKPTGAEARAKARRCPSCGGVVGVGMSLCNTCGLDLDTGQRIAPLDVFDDDMPVVHRAETPPVGVIFVGTLSILTNIMLAVVSLVAAASEGSGMLFLLVVWIFGIWASVQFLRRKSIRPLFLALGLVAAIGTVFLIILPIWYANEASGTEIHNLADQIDMKKIMSGIFMLLGYAGLSIYLNSPPIKREFTKK